MTSPCLLKSMCSTPSSHAEACCCTTGQRFVYTPDVRHAITHCAQISAQKPHISSSSWRRAGHSSRSRHCSSCTAACLHGLDAGHADRVHDVGHCAAAAQVVDRLAQALHDRPHGNAAAGLLHRIVRVVACTAARTPTSRWERITGRHAVGPEVHIVRATSTCGAQSAPPHMHA